MSDTPRTDAVRLQWAASASHYEALAQTLERENADLRKQLMISPSVADQLEENRRIIDDLRRQVEEQEVQIDAVGHRAEQAGHALAEAQAKNRTHEIWAMEAQARAQQCEDLLKDALAAMRPSEEAALRNDAERYRWLRSASVANGGIKADDHDFWNDLGDKLNEDFDDAIDAAMRGGE